MYFKTHSNVYVYIRQTVVTLNKVVTGVSVMIRPTVMTL